MITKSAFGLALKEELKDSKTLEAISDWGLKILYLARNLIEGKEPKIKLESFGTNGNK